MSTIMINYCACELTLVSSEWPLPARTRGGGCGAEAICFVRHRSSHVVHMRYMPAVRDSTAEERDLAWVEDLHNVGA
jgi:hypothetical protein